MKPHQWTKPTDLIPWRHCQRCGVIRRADKINSKECKGPVKVEPREFEISDRVREAEINAEDDRRHGD